MSPLAVRVGAGVLALLALIALRGKRWAYFAFIVLGLAYFPAQTHFRVHVPKCEQILPTLQVLVLSLHNYAYIAVFAGFYWMSWIAFRRSDARVFWALFATLLVAVLVEVAEGMTSVGRGQVQCRVRDLAPYIAGGLGAALLLAIWSRLRRKPAYVRLVKPRSKDAPPPAAPPPRAVVPPRGVVPPPPPRGLPGLYVPPPSPRTFHRVRSLLSQRRTSLRRKRSRPARGGRGRRAERSLYVERSCNAFRRSGDVSGKCYNACG